MLVSHEMGVANYLWLVLGNTILNSVNRPGLGRTRTDFARTTTQSELLQGFDVPKHPEQRQIINLETTVDNQRQRGITQPCSPPRSVRLDH